MKNLDLNNKDWDDIDKAFQQFQKDRLDKRIELAEKRYNEQRYENKAKLSFASFVGLGLICFIIFILNKLGY